MDSKIEFNELCRLCLARKNVNIHIFEGEGCKEGIFLKISTCLPVNISLEDKLPKRICSNCFGKLNILYQFYNKSVNSEKQLLEWYNECATENDNETFTDNIDIEMTQDDSEVEVKEEELPFLPEENVNYNIKLEEVNVQDISHQVNEMSHEECSDTIGSNAVTNGEVDTLKSEDDEDGSSVTSNPLRTEINSRYTKILKMSESKPRKIRGSTWDEDSLRRAMEAVQNNQLNTNAAALKFNIPRRTLRNHLSSGNSTKIIGKTTILTKQLEEDLLQRIKRFAKLGVPLTPKFIRKQAFLFCERFKVKHSFNMSTRMAGRKWLTMFLSRNPSISKRIIQIQNSKRSKIEKKKSAESEEKE